MFFLKKIDHFNKNPTKHQQPTKKGWSKEAIFQHPPIMDETEKSHQEGRPFALKENILPKCPLSWFVEANSKKKLLQDGINYGGL